MNHYPEIEAVKAGVSRESLDNNMIDRAAAILGFPSTYPPPSQVAQVIESWQKEKAAGAKAPGVSNVLALPSLQASLFAGEATFCRATSGSPARLFYDCGPYDVGPEDGVDMTTKPTSATMVARAAALLAVLLAAACGGSGGTAAPATSPSQTPTTSAGSGRGASARAEAGIPAPRRVVLVVMENHSYGQIIGNRAAPFINGLARQGALFTRSFAVTHPSEPNYLALFSGSTQGITDDSCPHRLNAANLAADLAASGRSFTGYAEDLPSVGSPVCTSGDYARKHAPWADFANVPASDSRPFSAFAALDPAALPTVSWVIPNLCHDMHDCEVATGDAWLRDHLGGYVQWAKTHASLLILTWDEDDRGAGNHIATVFVGQPVMPGRYAQRISHYNVLATLEAAYRLPRDGNAANAAPISGIWSGP